MQIAPNFVVRFLVIAVFFAGVVSTPSLANNTELQSISDESRTVKSVPINCVSEKPVVLRCCHHQHADSNLVIQDVPRQKSPIISQSFELDSFYSKYRSEIIVRILDGSELYSSLPSLYLTTLRLRL